MSSIIKIMSSHMRLQRMMGCIACFGSAAAGCSALWDTLKALIGYNDLHFTFRQPCEVVCSLVSALNRKQGVILDNWAHSGIRWCHPACS